MGRDSASATKLRQTTFRAYVGDKRYWTVKNWLNYPASLKHIIDRLTGVIIENRDAREVVREFDGPDSLHYVDPPYVLATRDKGQDYRFGMDDASHEKLISEIKNLKGIVILSGYDCEIYSDLLGDWHKVSREALADGGVERTEVLWLSPNLPFPRVRRWSF
jgi:DNA adenine methylase